MPGLRRPTGERFWAKVLFSETGCWEWQGHVSKQHGYGQFDHRYEPRAHRAAWRLTHGPIPRGLKVLHSCDNRRCVRPDHLFLGTQKINMEDCYDKGRFNWGTRHPLHKLDDAKIREIRNLYAMGVPITKLGPQFGVLPCRIYLIVQRKAWRHVQ